MKLEKKYATLIVVIIILIFLFSLSFFSKFVFTSPVTISGNETSEKPPVVETPQQKTFSFASSSCSVSGDKDIIRFKIKSTGIDIRFGEMASFLDDIAASFKDSGGNSLNLISLKAGSTSDEFSYTAADHKPSRKITVSSPAGTIDQTVTCS